MAKLFYNTAITASLLILTIITIVYENGCPIVWSLITLLGTIMVKSWYDFIIEGITWDEAETEAEKSK